ncbi:MAG: nucleotidyltransferase domain-containing protein [Candidatus Nealsonbacteria bacterium]
MDILKITKSKTREKILRHFFSDPNKRYYLRQLEKILGLSVGNVRRELLSLEKSGLFKKEEVGNQTYYFLNKEGALFNEYQKIIFKTIGVEGELRKELKKIKGIKRAFIFGSFAKNKEDSASDIDLMIIGTVDEDVLITKISKLENIFNREINYHIWGQEEFEEKAKTESFIQSILEESKIELI